MWKVLLRVIAHDARTVIVTGLPGFVVISEGWVGHSSLDLRLDHAHTVCPYHPAERRTQFRSKYRVIFHLLFPFHSFSQLRLHG